MPPHIRPRDAKFLWDMLEAAREVQQFIAGRTFDEYVTDAMLRRAVERSIGIIGEGTRRVSKACRNSNPGVPWEKFRRQRNLLAHEYGEIDDAIMWKIATVHVPRLIEKLRPLVPRLPGRSDPGR